VAICGEQGNEELGNEPFTEGGEESENFRVVRGKAPTEIRGQFRELPIKRPIIGFFDITVLLLSARTHAFCKDVDNGIKGVMATGVPLEMV